MQSGGHAERVSQHYGRDGLGEAIVAALREMGKDPQALAPEDLAPVDQFHTGGLEATLEVARLAEVRAGSRVLDVGGGLGGGARVLAHRFGCRVTVLDLTEAFCRVGADLTARVGLADQVDFRHGDALAMPFPDGAFDLVWSQHASMNIPDKAALYAEAHRVLVAGGRLALHEIMAGPGGPIHLPVPWARELAASHLLPAEDARALLARAGFVERAWKDTSTEATHWFRRRLAPRAAGGPPPLGLHLVLGSDAPVMFANLLRNLEESRVAVVQAVLARG